MNDNKIYELAESKMGLKIAEDLRRFVVTKDSECEEELLSSLSKSPSFLSTLFPNEGDLVSKEIIRKKLNQLTKQSLEVREIIFKVYKESLDIHANVCLEELEKRGKTHLFRVYQEEKYKVLRSIQDSDKMEITIFENLMQQAEDQWGHRPEILAKKKQSINAQMDDLLEANNKAVGNLLKILTPE